MAETATFPEIRRESNDYQNAEISYRKFSEDGFISDICYQGGTSHKVNYDDRIESLANLSPNRKQFIAEEPSRYSRYIAFLIGKVLRDFGVQNAQISPSPEGGIMFEFINDEIYYLIEVYNDGDLVFLNRLTDGTRDAGDYNLQELINELSERFGS